MSESLTALNCYVNSALMCIGTIDTAVPDACQLKVNPTHVLQTSSFRR